MAGLFNRPGFIFGAHPRCGGCSARHTALVAMWLWLAGWALLPTVSAAAVWEDPDAEATERAVQIHLIRLASSDPNQVAQAKLGLESLGLNALRPLQTALQEDARSAAEKEKIQALIDYLQTAAVIELHDQFGAVLAYAHFQIRVYSPPTAAELQAMNLPGVTELKTLPRLQANARTDAAGRLVVFGLPDGDNLSLFLFHLPRRLADGVAHEISGPDKLVKRHGEILNLNMIQPIGVQPAIEVRGDRNQLLPFAAIAVFAADAETWRWTGAGIALPPDQFHFDLDRPDGQPDSLARWTALQLWNPATHAGDSRFGICILRTDAAGELEPGLLPPGQYGLWILATGYEPMKVPEFKLPRNTSADAEPTVFKLTPTPRSFCAGALRTPEDKPLKSALVYLLPVDQVYDPSHIQELDELERRRADLRRVAALRAGKPLEELPARPVIPAYTAATVPLDYIQELTAYPQVRVARSQASGRIEFRDLAEGKYVLRVFVAPPDDADPAHAVEWRPASAAVTPLTVSAKDGGPIDLATLQYQAATPAAQPAPPAPPAPAVQDPAP